MLLGALVATAEQDREYGPALHEVDPVAGSMVDPKFADALADRPHVTRVAERKPADADVGLGPRLQVAKAGEPILKLVGLANLDYMCIVLHTDALSIIMHGLCDTSGANRPSATCQVAPLMARSSVLRYIACFGTGAD